jgi:hypothetical protein
MSYIAILMSFTAISPSIGYALTINLIVTPNPNLYWCGKHGTITELSMFRFPCNSQRLKNVISTGNFYLTSMWPFLVVTI